MDEDALSSRVNELEEELMNLRFKHGSAQLEQTAQLKKLRRRIARIKTILSERMSEPQEDNSNQQA